MPEMLQIEPPQQKQQTRHEIRSSYDPKQTRQEALAKVTKLVDECRILLKQNPNQNEIISSFSMIVNSSYREQIIGIYSAIVEETNYRLSKEDLSFHLEGKLEGSSFYFVAGCYDRNGEIDDKERKKPPKLEEMELTLNEPKRQAIMELAYVLSGKSRSSFAGLSVEKQVKAIHKAVQYMVVDENVIEDRKKFYVEIGYARDFWFFIKPKDSVGVKLPNETLPAGLKAGSVAEGDCDEVALICRAVLGSCGIRAEMVQFSYTKEEAGGGNVIGHTTLLSVGNRLLVIDSALLKDVEELKLDEKDTWDGELIKEKITELYKDREGFDISRIAILDSDNRIKARTLENNWYEISNGAIREGNIEWIRRALEADQTAVLSNVVLGIYLSGMDLAEARRHFLSAFKYGSQDFDTNLEFAKFVNGKQLDEDYEAAYQSIKFCNMKKPGDEVVLLVKQMLEEKMGLKEEAAKTKQELEELNRKNH